MEQMIDVVCPVSVLETGRIHPSTFKLIRGEDGEIERVNGYVRVEWVDFHKNGFGELDSAMRWLQQTDVRAIHYALGFSAAVRCHMAGRRWFKEQDLVPFETILAQVA